MNLRMTYRFRKADAMDMKKLKEFVKLQAKKRELEGELQKVKDTLGDLDQDLQKEFVKDGVQNMKVGGFTVFLSPTIYAGPEIDKEDLIKALKKAKLGYLVKPTYNSQSLSAYARALQKDKKKMPKSLVGHMKVTEVFKMAARKS